MTREEAIEILKKDGCGYCTRQSINPYECENKECEVKQALEMAIKALENHDTFMKYAYSQGKQDALSQEPCTDAVSREAVINIVKLRWDYYKNCIEAIEKLPSVTQKSGKWIYRRGDKYSCSKCGTTTSVDEAGIDEKPMYKFCPYCGAKMVEPQESEVSE